jgi:hypothetical protein
VRSVTIVATGASGSPRARAHTILQGGRHRDGRTPQRQAHLLPGAPRTGDQQVPSGLLPTGASAQRQIRPGQTAVAGVEVDDTRPTVWTPEKLRVARSMHDSGGTTSPPSPEGSG